MLRNVIALGVMLTACATATLAASPVPLIAPVRAASVAMGPFMPHDPPMTAGQPFSVVTTMESTTVFQDGNRIVRTNTTRYFRDGQGRVRIERSLPGSLSEGLQNTSITVQDPVSGERYDLIPRAKMAMMSKLPQPGTIRGRAMLSVGGPVDAVPYALLGLGMSLGAGPATEAASETTALGQKVVGGVNATGTRIVRTIATGALGNEKPISNTLEEWDSADLGIPVQVTEISSLGGTVTLSLGQLVFAEPDPSLFTVPADYTVRDISMPMTTSGAGAAGFTTGVVVGTSKP